MPLPRLTNYMAEKTFRDKIGKVMGQHSFARLLIRLVQGKLIIFTYLYVYKFRASLACFLLLIVSHILYAIQLTGWHDYRSLAS